MEELASIFASQRKSDRGRAKISSHSRKERCAQRGGERKRGLVPETDPNIRRGKTPSPEKRGGGGERSRRWTLGMSLDLGGRK